MICTVPPPLQDRISWLPRLGARKRWAVDSCRMGILMKVGVIIIIIIIIIIILQVILHYDRPHWREAGLSGQLVSTGIVNVAYDYSAEGGAALLAFVGGDQAVLYCTDCTVLWYLYCVWPVPVSLVTMRGLPESPLHPLLPSSPP